MPQDELLPQDVRAHQFPLTADLAYLNTATQGPVPSATRRAIEEAAARAQFPETPRGRAPQPPADAARAALARLLRVAEDDLAFTQNTTHGLNICAQGIEWRPGDNVVLPENEFPSVQRTWLSLRAAGVEVRQVPFSGAGPSVDELMAAVDGRTRAVACSAVTWDTGYRMDLEALGRRCAAAGALLVVDGIQLVGAADLDLSALQVSAIAFHGYKWLTSGFGCGVLYVSPRAIDRIRPRFVGEQSFQGGGWDPPSEEWQPGARRYQAGGANGLGLVALAASLAQIEELGIGRISDHNRRLGELLVAGLARHAPGAQLVSPADPARRASIVTFTLGDRARDGALVAQLEERGVVVAHRPRGVRVSPHYYNTEADVERLLRALPEAIG